MKNLYVFFIVTFFSVQIFAQEKSMGYSSTEFVENQGQWDAPFLYKCKNSNSELFLKKNGYTVLLADANNDILVDEKHHGKKDKAVTLNYFAYHVDFLNSNTTVDINEEKIQKHYYNFYNGNDSKRWKNNIHPCGALSYKNLYEGINMRIYSANSQLKYDFIVNPNADYTAIKVKYTGAEKLSLENGKLVVKTSIGNVNELAPYTYQLIDGEKKEIACKYVLENNIVSFKITEKYNPAYALYIDPTLVFCSFTASTADNWGYTATYDSSGNLYAGGIVGYTNGGSFSGNYPTTTGAFQTTFGGGGPGGMGNVFRYDATISKFSSNGTSLIFSTYLGGSDNDQPQSLIVDHNDNLIVAGRTYSTNYPTTTGAYDVTYNGGADLFVSKFSSTGAMLASTYVGGNGDDAVNVSADENTITPTNLKHNYSDDARSEVIMDANNNIYVVAATTSTNFPTVAASQTTNGGLQDAVVIELNSACTNLLWGTYIGGSQNDAAYVLCINKTNPTEIYVAGGTMSSNLATTSGTIHSTYQGGIDGFVFKFNTITKALIAGTYIGTTAYDQVYGIQTDDSNNVYIMGQTMGAYPVIPNATTVYNVANSSQFVSIINTSLTTINRSTVFGTGTTATTDIAPNAFLVDKCQNIYMSGWGGPIIATNPGSTNGLTVTSNAIKLTTDGSDFYFIVFSKNIASLVYASFFGQTGGVGEHVDGGTSRFDENGVIYQAICARCGNASTPSSIVFPTTPGVWGPLDMSDNCNLAALKIKFDFQNPDAKAIVGADSVGCVPLTVAFQNSSTSSTDFVWDFGDGTPTSTATNPSHTFTAVGNYIVRLIANNPNGCTSSSDTAYMTIKVKADTIHAGFTIKKVDSCGPFTATFVNTSTSNVPNSTSTYVWDFGDGTTFTGANPPLHTFPSNSVYTVTLTMTDTNACNNPSTATVILDFNTSILSAGFDAPDSVCMPAIINFNDLSTNATGWNWTFGDGNTASISSPTNNYLSPGVYTVTLIAANPATCNKLDTASQTITVFTSPIADFTWTPIPPKPNTPNVFTNYSTGATNYFWDFGDGSSTTTKNPTHVYNKDGEYNVCLTATNEFGCKDSVCKKVRTLVVPIVDVPSGFSPNGDGINDIVYVKGYGINNMTFKIFNRWGEKVFESHNKNDGWDGRYKGVIQEMEVYQYTLSVDFADGTSTFKKGSITLLK